MNLDISELIESLEFNQKLRYGENPHQEAAWYNFLGKGLSNAKQLQGKELSYNNLIDLEAAISTVQEFQECAAVVIKHTNPCGVGIGEVQFEALSRALDADRISAFGGIVACNYKINHKIAIEINKTFFEVILAKGFDKKALRLLKKI